MEAVRHTSVRARLQLAALCLLIEATLACLPALGLAPRGLGGLLPGLAAVAVFAWLRTRAPRAGSGLTCVAVLIGLQAVFVVAATHIGRLALALDSAHGDAMSFTTVTLTTMLLAAPILAGAGALLQRWQLEPSHAAKASVTFLGLTIGALSLAICLEAGQLEFAFAVVAGVLAIPALLIATTCASALLAAHHHSALMSAWVLSLVSARSLGGWTHALAIEQHAVFEACMRWGWFALAIAVAGSWLWRPLSTLASVDWTMPKSQPPRPAALAQPLAAVSPRANPRAPIAR